jgi:hypothetical protein
MNINEKNRTNLMLRTGSKLELLNAAKDCAHVLTTNDPL